MIAKICTFKYQMNQVKSRGRSCCMDGSLAMDDKSYDLGKGYICQNGRNMSHI